MDLKISDKAFQLAKGWVKSMSGGENLDSEDTGESEFKIDGRPARLGLGAECMPHSQLTAALNPLEKKLKAKLNISQGAACGQETKHLMKTHPVTDKSNSRKRLKEDMDGEDDGGRAAQFDRKQSSSTLIAHLLEPCKAKKKRKKVG